MRSSGKKLGGFLSSLYQRIIDENKAYLNFITEIEYGIIKEALTNSRSITSAARRLRIKRSTLSMKIIMLKRAGFVFDHKSHRGRPCDDN